MKTPLTTVWVFRVGTLLALIVPVPGLLRAGSANGGDATQGQRVFERRCTGCHHLDEVRTGPPLRGVFGRAAGGVPGFPYSTALKSSGFTWSETTLNRWLTDTDALVPNNDMAFRVSSADERAEIIAYLKEISR